jgi:hypothetical protein
VAVAGLCSRRSGSMSRETSARHARSVVARSGGRRSRRARLLPHRPACSRESGSSCAAATDGRAPPSAAS